MRSVSRVVQRGGSDRVGACGGKQLTAGKKHASVAKQCRGRAVPVARSGYQARRRKHPAGGIVGLQVAALGQQHAAVEEQSRGLGRGLIRRLPASLGRLGRNGRRRESER